MSDSALKSAPSLYVAPNTEFASPYDDENTLSLILKRVRDIVFSLLALIFLSPVLLAIAILIKYRYPGVPVIYGNPVIGKDRRFFRMWKFSTMSADAHLVLDDLLSKDEALRNEWQQSVKLQNDPRILPGLGAFLRSSSLNELPQFFNVLIGDMSLVGPRPISEAEEEPYLRIGGATMLAHRHKQRPGITGLWQATGRSDVSYEERVALDNAYLRSQSFWFDMKIMWWTFRKVISREGAV